MNHKDKLRKHLHEICKPYCTSEWCILKEMLLNSHDSLRVYDQVKMIEKLKWNMSQREKREVCWEESSQKWVESGMAKAFANYYKEDDIEDLDIDELYSKIERECNPF